MEILLVDDDPEDALLFKEALSNIEGDFKFCHTSGYEKISEILDNFFPKLIFLDVHLPKVSGIQCLRNIRAKKAFRTTPIIMYSSYFNQQYMDMCYKEKANYFFVKPNTFMELMDMIKNVISINWEEQNQMEFKNFIIE
jgi:DNA-binding response OmpR family regulator